MSKSVKFADETFIEEARTMSELQSRSLAGQIMHWAKIGRAIEKSRDFDSVLIASVLSGEKPTTVLSPEEKAVWSERFLEKMAKPGPDEEVFFAEMRKAFEDAGAAQE